MSSFESFPPPLRQENQVQPESSTETPDGLAEWLMQEWKYCVESARSRNGQGRGETDEDRDASNLILEHLDQLDEDRIIEDWADEVPDAMKPEVAARLRMDADPKLVNLLDKYARNFTEPR